MWSTRKKTVLIAVISTLTLVGTIITAAMFYNAGPTTRERAIQMCQEKIRGKLKAPVTARFVARANDVRLINVDDKVYVVTGAVDAENSFGASIRTDFRCTMNNRNDELNFDKVEFVNSRGYLQTVG